MDPSMYDSDGSDEYDSDDTSFREKELPHDVRMAQKKRFHINFPPRNDNGDYAVTPPSQTSLPVDQHAVKLLRDHISAGRFEPQIEGGYIELMQHLGATPKSTDPYVKDPDCN
eukprot:12015836-Ditylum_brightwellii.AAC.1